MSKQLVNAPEIEVLSGCEVKEIEMKDLNEAGETFVFYGVSVDDIIEFPATEEELHPHARQLRKGGTAYENIVLVNKNGEPAWFSVSLLRRADEEKKQSCGTACDELKAKYSNDGDRLRAVLGKKLKAADEVVIKVRHFEGGRPTKDLDEKTIVTLDWYEE